MIERVLQSCRYCEVESLDVGLYKIPDVNFKVSWPRSKLPSRESMWPHRTDTGCTIVSNKAEFGVTQAWLCLLCAEMFESKMDLDTMGKLK